MKRRPQNLRGAVSGYLVATCLIGQEVAGGSNMWRCICKCGNRTKARACQITKGTLKSCGCLRRELSGRRARKHGKGRTPEAARWRAMINRCHNPKDTGFKRYGARGIWVCERWRRSFEEYLVDVGEVPKGYHVDRVNNDLGYCCGKCQDCESRGIKKPNWRVATVSQNQRNRRDNRLITVSGITKTLTEWSEITGIKVGSLWSRLDKGWSEEKAILTPIRGCANAANVEDRLETGACAPILQGGTRSP